MVDTNVLVRAIVADDPGQVRRARKLLKSSCILLLESVILELEWVLRYSYEMSREEVGRALRVLVGLRNVQVTRKRLVLNVIGAYEKGFDFADALHYECAEGLEVKTFDRKFVNRAKKEGWKVSLV